MKGRHCPLHYRYPPTVFDTAAPAGFDDCEVLYVVGGLYGNEPALERVLAQFERERGRKRLVFNGDFHWFDVDPDAFARVQAQVLAHDAIRGNVETEVADESTGADNGCGCGYPEWVDDGVVDRSNRILARLRGAAAREPALMRQLAALPMWRRVDVGGLRVAVVHGDATSLAGWGFAQEHLRDPAHLETVRGWFEAAGVDAFACSHTCLPVFQAVPGAARHAAGPRLVLNNGAAGMPNFHGDLTGLLTRIAARPFDGPGSRLHLQQGEIHIDAIAIDYDVARWHRQFLQQWPIGSDAHASYWERLSLGPRFAPAEALRDAGAAQPAAVA
jgi:hypothetical protein